MCRLFVSITIVIVLCFNPASASDEISWDNGQGTFEPQGDIEAALIGVDNNYYGNDRAVLGEHSDFWYESQFTGGGQLRWVTEGAGTYSSNLSIVLISSGGYDASLSNINHEYVNRIAWREANLAWQGTFGERSKPIDVDVSAGRQSYVLGTGFILGTGGDDGGNRGNEWIGPHDFWRLGFLGKVELPSQTFQVYQLTPDDEIYSQTHLAGADLAFHGDWGQWAFGGLDIFHSDIDERKQLHLFNVRYDYTLPDITGWDVKGEYVYQRIDEQNQDTFAWYAELGYTFTEAANTRLSYRFANFSAEYDPLFPGGDDWGAWYIGEYLGQYQLVNQNFQNHQVRLTMQPTDTLIFNAIYYFYRINELGKGQFADPVTPITDKNLTHEIDLILEYAVTDQLTLKFINVYTLPERGAIQWSGGDKTVSYFLGYVSYSFF
ncbi:Uncharacterised protein [BD1-7 clade bacterium]|nr:Uncharacterised protein [BD1-7 clade bacterium]